jgi:hypothetical protein
MVNLRSNTSLIGLGSTAKIVRGNLMVGAGVSNVIIRNIAFEDDFDYFPAWDPGDGFALNKDYPGCQEVFADASSGPQRCPGGRWNSEYDNISINGGTRVWIDRCLFSDGDRPDSTFPPVFPFPHNQIEQKVQHHDGLVDITNGADFVTLSHNVFKDHDKTSLIGGSDSLASDAGKLSARENHLAVLKHEPKHHTFRGALALGKDGSFCSRTMSLRSRMAMPAMPSSSRAVPGSPTWAAASMARPPISAPSHPRPPLPTSAVKAYVQANAGPGKL